MAINVICQTLFADCLFSFFSSQTRIINSNFTVEQLRVCSIAIRRACSDSVFHQLCRFSVITEGCDA